MGIEKIILGLILVIVGLWLILPVSWGCKGLWHELWLVIKGVVPAFLIFIGAILVWIESEELKMSRPAPRVTRKKSGSYYCTKCKRNHSKSSKIGKKHRRFEK